MKALRVVNPKITEDQRFQRVAHKACEVSLGQFVTIPPSWIEDQDGKAVFIAYEGRDIKGVTTLSLQDFPQWTLFYADSPEAKRALVGMGVDFLRDKGYTRFCAVNTSGAPDSVWKRAFWRNGEASKIGTIMEFKL